MSKYVIFVRNNWYNVYGTLYFFPHQADEKPCHWCGFSEKGMETQSIDCFIAEEVVNAKTQRPLNIKSPVAIEVINRLKEQYRHPCCEKCEELRHKEKEIDS